MTPPAASAARVTSASAVVLCGGTSRRMGGADKTRAALGPGSVLDHLLDRLPAPWGVVCVGEERATTRGVRWRRESPPAGGPVAGIAAGLVGVQTDLCVVAGGDMPFAAAALVRLLRALTGSVEVDAVVGVGPDGRTQPLLAAYRTDALRRALPADPRDVRLMSLLDGLSVSTLPCTREECLDVDTPPALALARQLAGEPPGS